MSKIWTIKDILSWTTKYFSEKDIDAPRLTAELLLAKSLKKERLYLYTNFSKPLNREELADYKALIVRRGKGEPTAYITGEKEFWSLTFKVNENVLIPRPDSEIIVEKVIETYKNVNEQLLLLDVGTGSGNISVALAKELENVKIITTDISFNALTVALENIKTHSLLNKISIVNGDLFSHIKFKKFFNVIVSNPPYISEEEFENLQREVKDFEPKRALYGGEDGLMFFKKILDDSKKVLKREGMLFLEFGVPEQGEKISALMKFHGYSDIKIYEDYSGKPRVIRGTT